MLAEHGHTVLAEEDADDAAVWVLDEPGRARPRRADRAPLHGLAARRGDPVGRRPAWPSRCRAPGCAAGRAWRATPMPISSTWRSARSTPAWSCSTCRSPRLRWRLSRTWHRPRPPARRSRRASCRSCSWSRRGCPTKASLAAWASARTPPSSTSPRCAANSAPPAAPKPSPSPPAAASSCSRRLPLSCVHSDATGDSVSAPALAASWTSWCRKCARQASSWS